MVRRDGRRRARKTAKRNRPEPKLARTDILVETFVGRTADWEEIYVEDPQAERAKYDVDIVGMARMMSVEPDDVLTWLRAGCPYTKEGDWTTGSGFKLHLPWVSEWTTLVFARCVATGQSQAKRALGLGRFATS